MLSRPTWRGGPGQVSPRIPRIPENVAVYAGIVPSCSQTPMHVYIDEAGPFIKPQTKPFSLVLALIVPATAQDDLFYEFLRARDQWPQVGVEIKGSTLDETQTAQVAASLTKHDVLA